MTGRPWTAQIAPWTGLFVGAAAWFADQRIVADGNAWNCQTMGGPVAVGVGVACLVVALAGGGVSWRSLRPHGEEPAQVTKFAATVGAASAAVFALAIVFGTLAGLLVPGCHP